MLKNYFIIAWRNLRKNKLFSFINIVGLSLAIPFSLMSLLQVQNAYELDNFHKDRDRIYRVITIEKPSNGNITKLASTPFLLADKLNDYPFIEKETKIVRDYGWELTNRLKTLDVNSIYVESSFFEMFNFPLEKGSIPIAPNELLITKEKADLFFADADPIGKTLTHTTYGDFKITGVLKPFKRGTQFRSDVMISMATYLNSHKQAAELKGWAEYGTYTFVKVKENVQVSSLTAALDEISKKSNAEILADAKKTNQFKPQPFKDISPAFDKLQNNPYVESVSDFYFNFFFAIAIILLAGFNYTNLTLARSLSRAKEVGIRKVAGAFRRQLIWQFIIEAIVVAVFALCLGAVFMKIIRNTLNISWISWEVDNNYILWAVYFLFAIFTGVVAGIFPAWILSGFQPVKVLKGIAGPASFGKLNLRKTLVVIQLVVSMCYIFFMGHLYSQFKYMATENENYNRKNIYNITLVEGNERLLINEILKNKNVEQVGLTSIPFGSNPSEYAVKANKNDENTLSYYFATDNYFIENMKLKIVAGSNLPVSNSDTAGNFILVNEKAVKHLRLGTAQEAVGKILILNNSAEVRIAGVLKDFCYANYQFEVQPVIMRYDPAQFHVLSVKTRTVDSENAFKAEMEDTWKKLYPHEAMVASWYHKDIYNRYFPIDDMKFMYLLAVIIFAITLMGLFGMVTYSTEKRIKEIGIRKVVGASVSQIVNLISWSYIKLLIIAGAIALPISYITGKMFESLFKYHDKLNISLMIFFLVVVFVITIATICVQVARGASVNPVKSLRTE